MKRALVLGASGGIGAAVVDALGARDCAVTALSRSADGMDVTDEVQVEAALKSVEGPFDLIFVAIGALTAQGREPEKAIRDLDPDQTAKLFAVNATGPMLILKHALPLLPRDARSVYAVLSARVGSIGDNAIGGWHSYRASKAALNQLIHGAAIELGRTHKEAIAVCLHPGTVETAFTEKYAGRHKTVSAEDAAQNLLHVIDTLTPEHSGGFYDYAGKEIPW